MGSSNAQQTSTETNSEVNTVNIGLEDVTGSVVATGGSTVNFTDAGAVAEAFNFSRDIASGSSSLIESAFDVLEDTLNQNQALTEGASRGAFQLASEANRGGAENVAISQNENFSKAAIALAVMGGIYAVTRAK